MQQLPIENATPTKRLGRPALNRQQVAEKHDEWYKAHLMGWSASEISQAYHVNKSSVTRAINAVRSFHSWRNRSARERHTDLLAEIYDGARLSMGECWKNYLRLTKEGKPEAASRFLGLAQRGLMVLDGLVPDSQVLYIEELTVKIREGQEKIRKWFEEKNMQKRILPVQNGS
jgi:hypothetical protein